MRRILAVKCAGELKPSTSVETLSHRSTLKDRLVRGLSGQRRLAGVPLARRQSCRDLAFDVCFFGQVGFQNHCMLLRDVLQALTLFLLWLRAFQCGIFQVDAAGFFREELGTDNTDLAVLRIVIAFWNRGGLGFLLWGCGLICRLFGLRLGRGNAGDARVGLGGRRLVGRGMIWQRLRCARLLLLPLHFLMIGCHVATA